MDLHSAGIEGLLENPRYRVGSMVEMPTPAGVGRNLTRVEDPAPRMNWLRILLTLLFLVALMGIVLWAVGPGWLG